MKEERKGIAYGGEYKSSKERIKKEMKKEERKEMPESRRKEQKRKV